MFKNNNIDFFKFSIEQERLVILNFKYLSEDIENWWKNLNASKSLQLAKFELAHLILQRANANDLSYFDQLGTNKIVAVTITNIFRTDCHRLARIIHETFSELFDLNDIKYPYEEHKNIYLKPGGEDYRDWGNGLGEITPHADDLYEDLNTDFLSLTVCRDTTNTPTEIFFPKDILRAFTNDEIKQLLDMKVNFISGKNISIQKSRIRNVVEYDTTLGFKFYLDFRIDTEAGERMIPTNPKDRLLIEKMRSAINICRKEKSTSCTGTFTIVANYKVLHARAEMHIDRNIAKLQKQKIILLRQDYYLGTKDKTQEFQIFEVKYEKYSDHFWLQ